jgi:hypothetical protein
MKTIKITLSEKQTIENNNIGLFLCETDIELPKMYNAGFNHYLFVGGEPQFIGIDMPEVLKMNTDNFTYYECKIMIKRNDNTIVNGYYLKNVNKNTGKTEVKFLFN